MSWWQVCPLGPDGLRRLALPVLFGLRGQPLPHRPAGPRRARPAEAGEIAPLAALGAGAVDFGALYRLKMAAAAPRVRAATGRRAPPPSAPRDSRSSRRPRPRWLEPYAWFRALKDHFGGGAWWEWPPGRADAAGPAGRAPHGSFATRWRRISSTNTRSSRSGAGSGPRPPGAGSGSSATSPSSSRRTRRTRGRARSSSSSERTAARSPSRACPPTTSPRTASSGAIRSIGGRSTPRTATRGGRSACGPRSTCTTSCGSTISADSTRTGGSRCRPPTRGRANGGAGPGLDFFRAVARALSRTRGSSPRTSAC